MPSNNPPGPFAHDSENARILSAVDYSKKREESLSKKEITADEERAERSFKSQQDRAFQLGMASGLFDSSDPSSKSKAIEYGAQKMRERADDHGRDGDNNFDGRLAASELKRRLSRYDQEEQDEELRRKFIQDLRDRREKERQLPSKQRSNIYSNIKRGVYQDPKPFIPSIKDPVYSERAEIKFEGDDLNLYISDTKRSLLPREQRLKEEAIKISEEKTYDQVKGRILLEDYRC